MLEACGKAAWNLKKMIAKHQTTGRRVFSSSTSVWDSYDNLFKAPAKNCSLFRLEKEVLVNLRTQTATCVDTDVSLQSIIRFLLHCKPALIGEQTKGKECSLSFSRGFEADEDCVTSSKNLRKRLHGLAPQRDVYQFLTSNSNFKTTSNLPNFLFPPISLSL